MDAHSPTSLGFFFVLPLEIRDLIYHHVFLERYCYTGHPRPIIGLLGTSKALRDEATHRLYSHNKFQVGYTHKLGMEANGASYLHLGNFNPDFPSNPVSKWPELAQSQGVIKRLDHVEIPIDMDDYSFERFPGAIPMVCDFYNELFRKIASVDRVRKTCRIIVRNTGISCQPGDEHPFSPNVRRLSTFRTVSIEVECEAIEFEDFEIVDRGPIDIPWDAGDDFRGSALHVRMVSLKELTMWKLRTYLEETLGIGVYDTRSNVRCLTFHPQSTQV